MSLSNSPARKSRSKAKAKRKAAAADFVGAPLPASRLAGDKCPPPSASNSYEVEAEWQWKTLIDSSVPSRPAVFTADGNYFFSVNGSCVRIYSVATRKIISILSSASVGNSDSRVGSGGHTDTITSAILNPEDPFQLLTASLDGDVKMWNFLDATVVRTIRIGRAISHMCTHEKLKGQAFVAVPAKQKISDSQSLDSGSAVIYRVSLSQKHPTSSEYTRPAQIARVGKTKAVVSLGISASGSWLVVIGGNKAYVSPTSISESGFNRFIAPEPLTCLAFHPIEDYFATGDTSGQIRLWFCLDGRLISSTASESRAQTTTMHWHAHAVSSVAFTTNGAYLLSGGEESVLVIWQLQTGRKEFVPRLGLPILTISVRNRKEAEEEYLVSLADGTYLFISSSTLSIIRTISRIKLDPKETGRPTHAPIPLASHRKTSALILPASHPSSLQIYSPGTSALWEVEVSPTNRVSRRDEKEIEDARVDFVAVTTSGEWMATIDSRENEEEFSAEVNLKIWRWDGSSWLLNTRIERPHGSKHIAAMAFSPNFGGGVGEVLMTVGLDGNVRTWCILSNIADGSVAEGLWTIRSILTFRAEIPSNACWSLDGSILAVAFGRQIALYNPRTNVTFDCLTTMDIRNIHKISFVGKRGKYLLANGRNNAVLWNLVTRTVCWHFHSSSVIAHALSHPQEDLSVLIVQPYSEDGAVRSSKVLHFSPASSQPFGVRTLPFRFRVVDWNGLNPSSRSLIGLTHSWNIVMCGDDLPESLDDGPQTIDVSSKSAKKTIFQDIFGESTLIDTSECGIPSSGGSIIPMHPPVAEGGDASHFDVPTYLSPPLETIYPSLMTNFLSKSLEPEEHLRCSPGREETEDMIVQDELPQSALRARTVDDVEVDSLIDIFRRYNIARATPARGVNGIVNGMNEDHFSGIQPSPPPSHTPIRVGEAKNVHRNDMIAVTRLSGKLSLTGGIKRRKSLT